MKIGVTDTGSGDKQQNYFSWLKKIYSEVEISLLSYTKENAGEIDVCNGLLLTGGVDVDPTFSKAEPIEKVGKFDTKRDEFEFTILTSAVKKNIPILGICRGLQVGNVFFGGTLVADLENDGFQKHSLNKGEIDIRHSVTVVQETMLRKIVGIESGEINSHHHQAAKKIADELIASSFSSDGVVESLEWKNKNKKPFLLLVQWHPERMSDFQNPFAENIGRAFIEAIQQSA